MIAPQTLVLSIIFSIGWGIYLVYALQEYGRRKGKVDKGAQVRSFRGAIVAFCVWMFCFAYIFRTAMVLAGLGEVTAGQIVFFSLLGTIFTGMIFVLVSLKYD